MESAPSPDVLTSFFTGLGSAMVEGLRGLFLLMLSSFAASPAISSMMLVPLSRRWPRLQNSPLLAGLSGAVLTFVAIYVIIAFFAALDGVAYDLNSTSVIFPYAAAVIIAVAVWVQYRHRSTFNISRAAGLGAAVMVPVIIMLAGP
ncbi:MAG: hypothetical protein ABL973_12895 [Micropepsaceae bacterium]